MKRKKESWINNASFYIKIWVPKPNINYKNHLMGMDEPFLSFQCHFVSLDEKTPYHDYPDAF